MEISMPSQLDSDGKKSNTHEATVNNDSENKMEKSQKGPGSQANDVNETTTGEDSDESQTHQYATPRELALLSTVFTIATFMIAIDGSILEMAFQPTFGRLYTLFNARVLYLTSVIIWRVISGIGAAGLLCGSLSVYGRSVPLRARPFGMALVTSMYGVAGVLGPTLGGLVTDTPRLTWRFCFWINLPFGAVTFGIAYKILRARTPIHGQLSLRQKLKKLDLLGGFLLIVGLIKHELTGQSLTIRATIPMRILSQRTVAISCTFNMLMSMAHNTHIESSMGQWIGFQILSGAGIGLAEQVPFIAVQVVLPDSDMPTACAMVVFHRLLGGAVGLSIASNLFSQELYRRLAGVPGGVNVRAIQDAGASDLAKAVPAAVLPFVQKAFRYAISRAFILPIVVAGTSLILSFGMQRRWIPDDRVQPGQEANTGDEAASAPLDQTRDEKTV
ncbi:major facilitator superfamily transporter [Colletotrichum nymphaeae SA-01]|uniref:Major facilitator superfamily transporter n=1 Tax=Colletotrichum nymphaeae SA-01 TaxID=1460502 RepID=A0A135STM1_9PEZI|nr:major facilitator superfamily transporter [Colletotrichum nymphaeae SA-01]